MGLLNAEGIERDVVAIGASAGGIQVLIEVLSALPSSYRGIVTVVLHRSPHFESTLVNVLARGASLKVVEPRDGASLARGTIHLAPRDHHMTVDDGHVSLSRGPKEHFTRPAIDPLFRTIALTYGRRVVGVVLTGGGDDGVQGLNVIKARGGIAIVQKPDEATNPSMPLAALRHDHVDAAVSSADVAQVLVSLFRGESIGATGQGSPV